MVKEYKLKHPIVLGEETVEVLKLEEPTLGKMIEAEVELSEKALSTAAGMAKLIQACATNVTSAHVAKIRFSDLAPAVEACAGFFS